MKGDKLPANEKQEIVSKLNKYTGLSEKYIKQTLLRVEIGRFTKEFLRSDMKTVGRLDGRFTGTDLDAAGERLSMTQAIIKQYMALIPERLMIMCVLT
ncbi:hypothetical protein [Chondrinema litorale]|uniref:hypothetical protein n=1 Tax=Chondrinema litorale TaxID=2994555 RepID=UPI002543C25F|nr:hypothetical protein [Chondrinema litorale]UZR99937.1 hypothetical protein OQ292_38845 [Chondrinema litorale]